MNIKNRHQYKVELTINKDDFDLALKNKDINFLSQISKDLSLGMLVATLSEKERMNIINKTDEKFFNSLVFFLENKKREEEVTNKDYMEILFSQSTVKVKDDNKRRENNITKFSAHYTKSNNHSKNFIKEYRDKLINNFKNKYYDFFFDKIKISHKNIESIMNLDLNTKLQNKLARMCGELSNADSILNIVFSHHNYKKMSKHHFVRHAASATKDTKTLQFLMDNDPESLKKGFQTMLDKNDFWHDLKEDSTIIKNTQLEKVIWLEKNNMGYISNNMRGLIPFLCSINMEKIGKYFKELESPELLKYMDKSFSRYIKYHKNDYYFDNIIKKLEKKNKLDEQQIPPYTSEIPVEIEIKIKKRENIINYIKELYSYGNNYYEISLLQNIKNFDKIKTAIKHYKIESTLQIKEENRKTNKI